MAAQNTSTSHSDMIPTTWYNQIQLDFANQTKNGALAVATDASADVVGAVLNLPRQAAITLVNRVEGTPLSAAQFSAATRTLTIGTNKAQHLEFTDRLRAFAEGRYDILQPMIISAAAAVLKAQDASLCALYSSAGETATGTTGADITEALIDEAGLKLDDANAPDEGRFMVLSPKQIRAVTRIGRFSEVQTLGDGSPIRTAKPAGTYKGFTFYQSSNMVITTDGFQHGIAGVMSPMYEQASLAIAKKPLPNPMGGQEFINLPESGVRLVMDFDGAGGKTMLTIDSLYGVASPRTEWLVDVKTRD